LENAPSLVPESLRFSKSRKIGEAIQKIPVFQNAEKLCARLWKIIRKTGKTADTFTKFRNIEKLRKFV